MKEPAIYKQPKVVVTFLLLSIAATYYIIAEHNAHVRSALPTLLLLTFVVLHMRMHGGHGGHSHGSSDDQQTKARPDDDWHAGHGGHK